jgi:Protein of unknown function (DUF1203)
MSTFRVVALPTSVAQSVRETQKSPGYGFPAHRQLAAGRAPCRHCLKLIREQEEKLLLFTYDPFHEHGVPPLPGPVYLHAEDCPRHVESNAFPENYRGRKLTLTAYGAERALLEEIRVANGEEESKAEVLFSNPAVQYVHVRSTEAGCFLFRLERG